MPSGVNRGPDFDGHIARLWHENLTSSQIAQELEKLGWTVTSKIVRNYASKLGLERRKPPGKNSGVIVSTALTDQERAIFFRGLERTR